MHASCYTSTFLDKLLKISIYIVVLKILEIVSVLRQITEYIQLAIQPNWLQLQQLGLQLVIVVSQFIMLRLLQVLAGMLLICAAEQGLLYTFS